MEKVSEKEIKIKEPGLGNYHEYSKKLKNILHSASAKDKQLGLFNKLKTAILSGNITINTVYIPANSVVFAIVFRNKFLAETAIKSVINKDISIIDPLVEHGNDIQKAIESSIRFDVFLKDIFDQIFTMDMQRIYYKTRNRNREVYYGAKELAGQKVIEGKYERLKQVSITFIYENNTTKNTQAVDKIQLMNVATKEVYTDLLTLYEVNLNRIAETNKEEVPVDLVILRDFLSIKTHEDLCGFVNSYDTEFARTLIIVYMEAVVDDTQLLKIAGSERFMFKITEELLLEERQEGRQEGLIEGLVEGSLKRLILSIHRKLAKKKSREQIIDELELDDRDIMVLDNYDSYAHLLPS